jgi:hypothetical protein
MGKLVCVDCGKRFSEEEAGAIWLEFIEPLQEAKWVALCKDCYHYREQKVLDMLQEEALFEKEK